MNLIKPTFLLCVFGSTTFVMSCSGNTPVAGCSNGTKDERNFFIPSGTDHCAPNDTRWCCPAGKLLVSQVPHQNCLPDHVRLVHSPQSMFCHFSQKLLTKWER
ncbi:hypothetical protein MJO28_016296 [Puccinia striiformis f. sp. tritici]|uniref:Uncharacterized protein n=1 Tax=Puccinia striiformis f. sp. tritici TaxID=168172 RepID=A0ACC0DMX4_9BASI|nr:hypothetical protein MJO28_016296 [Puccinia striiformis f. sp. tritici]